MSYISTIGPLDDAAVSARVRDVRGFMLPAHLSGGTLGSVGGALASAMEGAVFLTIMGGLSLVFCGLVAGV